MCFTSEVGEFASGNYAISYIDGALTTVRRGVTGTADALSRIYGDANPALTYTVSGLVDGDTLDGALATGATLGSDVGSYAITPGSLGSDNYVILYSEADLTITPADLTVTYRATTVSSIYRSEEHPSELQSLMRISYAVFCLKKTKIHISINS